MMSDPDDPSIRSFPSAPTMMSLPPVPKIRSFPPVPTMVAFSPPHFGLPPRLFLRVLKPPLQLVLDTGGGSRQSSDPLPPLRVSNHAPPSRTSSPSAPHRWS